MYFGIEDNLQVKQPRKVYVANLVCVNSKATELWAFMINTEPPSEKWVGGKASDGQIYFVVLVI